MSEYDGESNLWFSVRAPDVINLCCNNKKYIPYLNKTKVTVGILKTFPITRF